MKTKRRNNNKRNRFSIVLPILAIVGIGMVIMLSSSYEKNWSYNWNGIRKSIKDSIKVSEFRAMTSGFGPNGKSTRNEVERRIWIMKNATESELLKLTDYPNGNVKSIAYEGLIRKKEFDKKTELTLEAIKDTTYLINYLDGDLGSDIEIGKYLVQNVLMIDDQIPPPPTLPDFGLSDLDKEKILAEFRKRPKNNY